MIFVIKIVKISDLGSLTLHSNGWCWDRTWGSVYVEHGVVFRWFWALLHKYGDSTPPCRIPRVNWKKHDVTEFHFTHVLTLAIV